MDIYSFINSKDITEHLRKIEYKFTTPEAAFIVWQNKTKTLKEKHAAWQEIIDTMPNCSMAERMNMRAIDDFHGFLRAYMEMQNDLIQKTYAKENSIYFYSLYCFNDDTFNGPYHRAYADIESCKKAILEYEDEENIVKVKIKKQMLAEPSEVYIIEYNGKFEITDVDAECVGDKWRNLLYYSFEGMWFCFPTPFKRGDIVVSHYSPWGEANGKCVFVLDSLYTWDKKQLMKNGFKEENCRYADKTLQQLSAYGDTSDMYACGYFQNDDGTLYGEVMHKYLDLEYYCGELYGKQKVLTALTMCMRGVIDTVTFANIYNAVLAKENAEWNIYRLNILDETKKKIGLR